MISEKECKEALDGLRNLERYENFKKWNGQVAPQVKADVIEQLIREHFKMVIKYDLALMELVEMERKLYNPPLTIDDLKRDQEVYCKSYGETVLILDIDKENNSLLLSKFDIRRYFEYEFEPDTFYRRKL